MEFTSTRRRQDDVAHRRTEAVLRQVEVIERAPDENAGGGHVRVHGAASVDDQHVRAALGQATSRLQAGQAGTNDDHGVAIRVAPRHRSRRFSQRTAIVAVTTTCRTAQDMRRGLGATTDRNGGWSNT